MSGSYAKERTPWIGWVNRSKADRCGRRLRTTASRFAAAWCTRGGAGRDTPRGGAVPADGARAAAAARARPVAQRGVPGDASVGGGRGRGRRGCVWRGA